jgi:VIT1/CCC1 family predicted Fe2+/Mn2+ transporter
MAVRKNNFERETRRFERKYLPEFVDGAMDGTITTFAVVSGVMGASLSSIVIFVLGFANLFADGFSFAASNYFSIKTKNELVKKQDKHPVKGAAILFLSFLLIGIIPLLSFILASITGNPTIMKNQFGYSVLLTGLALIIIGWFRGEVTGKHKVKSIMQTIVIGGIAALLAFMVGKIISVILI